MWQAIHSLFEHISKRFAEEQPDGFNLLARRRHGVPAGAPIVALVASDADRQVLTKVGDRELLDVSFAESREEAWDAMNRLVAPVILFDRDWPGADWRATVQAFASSPHQVCVILLSGVADDYLWQELIRCRGYDILTKPLRAGDVERVIKLALSFWKASGSALKHR